jgi:membrane protein YdbS with pleckstrin-like domain
MTATHPEPAAHWVYNGLWSVLVRWFRVPRKPPDLPVGTGDSEAFRPAIAFLRYLKLWCWISLLVIAVGLIGGWVAILVEHTGVGLVLLPVLVVLIVVPSVVTYVALHLRYDTTWYVMTDRAIRIRRGVWRINETTITFENVQNVKIQQGPVQRAMGIASVLIETAGSGGEQKKNSGVSNQGLIEGITDAPRIRDLILRRLRQSKGTGLGDEVHGQEDRGSSGWTPAHLTVLREIREQLRRKPG